MPSLSQAANLGFFSKYTVDKIVTKTPLTGSFSVSGFNNSTFDPGTGSITLTHNLNRKCLPELMVSSDGINYRPAPQADSNGIGAVASCSTNTVTIYAYQGIGTSTVTLYYILYLLWPN